MKAAYLGPEFTSDDIQDYLEATGARYQRVNRSVLVENVAQLLAEGKVVGWFQGRMEFGPRALGARSIIGDPPQPSNAIADEPQDKVSRVVSSFRAIGAA